ncbi:putative protein OS=Streptomyces fumanus OX=67302 GN=GCM10018772_14390 PE=4 SV=1 [Streptomyces fumanus]|uniref:Uncharacterized protein n=1 Tax=Streptomyces fumanus TaxID=67302 RepID=A0A919A802_9ACTN|nr:hypothetical protein GCM10018772_14390 [Streptomyces fumanus]
MTAEPVRLMTMRVTRIRDGRVIEQRPEVRVTARTPLDPFHFASAWPPCQCPRHRENAH